ncbi:MmcQ/YjbR family DNA-binding protein [Lachnoclostridium sp. Marseille-P6806]|uniref:MmcQ/YjbR family DNA-binding protein n=1 Tax=Lachnoclostridium sp. Marseille-P6806 TaxID=2364793 RepID=UPI0010323262|nr:MmcQ/YjbR family DNA-binding protein [Lachnoclostridium sp. Marseille-P6806]
MSIESDVFERTVIHPEKLVPYGFVRTENGYDYGRELMDGDFRAAIHVSEDGLLTGSVIDRMTDEEYLPLRAAWQTGPYVSTLRYEYEELLRDIAEHCGTELPFVSPQANRITERIRALYGDRPDFPWDDGNKASGVFRHAADRKWYGLIMRIDERKLQSEIAKSEAPEKKRDGPGKGPGKRKRAGAETEKPEAGETEKGEQEAPGEAVLIDVMNLKIPPEDGAALHCERGITPAFHMNHRTWISVRLDDTLSDKRIMELVAQSRRLTGGRAGLRRPAGCRDWVVPANLKYYDVCSDFDSNDDSDWKQGKGIEVGDIVYLYVGVPYSAILYKCQVTGTHIHYPDWESEGMNVHIMERYEKGKFGLKTVMSKFGVTTVRGPRFMPRELIEYIERNR